MFITKKMILINIGILITMTTFFACAVQKTYAPGTVNAQMLANIDAQWKKEQTK